MIVVDTNVIAYLVLPGERTVTAQAALARDASWAAPLLWRSELRNVLVRYLRAGHLGLDHAQALMATAEDILRGREYAVRSRDVLELAAQSGCSAYDCEFAALARELGAKLVTSDRQLLRAFPEQAVELSRFAAGH